VLDVAYCDGHSLSIRVLYFPHCGFVDLDFNRQICSFCLTPFCALFKVTRRPVKQMSLFRFANTSAKER